jgi:hypothetical protein
MARRYRLSDSCSSARYRSSPSTRNPTGVNSGPDARITPESADRIGPMLIKVAGEVAGSLNAGED